MNIVLVGMSGSGKTTVAYELNKLCGIQRIDCDELIEREFGNISNIFKKHGEEYFRDIETNIVISLSDIQSSVISTGGGCVLRRKNVDILKKLGKIVYLRTSVNEIEKRLKGDKSRPLLAGDMKNKLQKMLLVRDPIYSAIADLIIDTDDLSPQEVAKEILENIK